MNHIVEALKETKVFYVATMEGDQPRVRPFSAVMDYEGKAYFCTNNTKNVYHQIMKNPKVEICGCKPDGTWVRVSGKLVRDDSDTVRAAMLENMPMLKNIYSVGDGKFEVLALSEAKASLCSMTDAPKEITE
ncbi:pyridoxamine 5'-phosphate oxidase family protein [Caproicibacter sp.]|uniref:pyridoxamine 5'-phosphate oxidase family protein n=1 Tax=Caproicibacter sp. TaxID=2814884 RepID=UPI003988E37B